MRELSPASASGSGGLERGGSARAADAAGLALADDLALVGCQATPDAVVLGGEGVGPALPDHGALEAHPLGGLLALAPVGATRQLGVEEGAHRQGAAAGLVLPRVRLEEGGGKSVWLAHLVPPKGIRRPAGSRGRGGGPRGARRWRRRSGWRSPCSRGSRRGP